MHPGEGKTEKQFEYDYLAAVQCKHCGHVRYSFPVFLSGHSQTEEDYIHQKD
jgi:uncharacterized UBP type Zn finger protein